MFDDEWAEILLMNHPRKQQLMGLRTMSLVDFSILKIRYISKSKQTPKPKQINIYSHALFLPCKLYCSQEKKLDQASTGAHSSVENMLPTPPNHVARVGVCLHVRPQGYRRSIPGCALKGPRFLDFYGGTFQ